MKKNNKRKRLKLKKSFKIMFILIIIFCIFFVLKDNFQTKRKDKLVFNIIKNKDDEKKKQEKLYNECLKENLKEENYNNNYNESVEKLKQFLNDNTNFAYYYYDLNSNITYSKNEDSVFYGASVIKSALAIYIYNMALNDVSILDKEIAYSHNYYHGGAGVIKKNPQNSYSVRNLVKYMIEESDNIAFIMLYRNFNIKEVRQYYQNLGTKETFVGGDEFGHITANDCAIYLKELKKIIDLDNDISKELKQVFLNASKNSYIKKAINKDVLFKYGETKPNYHEITIVMDENPYILIILTTKFPNNHVDFINNLATITDNLHSNYYLNKKEYCQKKAFKE